ncbi:Nucleotidyltransferase [Daedalea quercina L-15889]|uniref:polynucleotide adenylyltransferase n=1 Tax=Daedalea quercina L-15889 TaxID=1314783 RepID=A0A165TH70_9APHY|nr:Nucleotidyltransferase [Daedalea quercina L-15889]
MLSAIASAARSPGHTIPATTGYSTSTTTNAASSAVRKEQMSKKTSLGMAEGTSWPWTTSLGTTEYANKERRLHDEIVAYVAYIMPTEQEIYARSRVIARVGDVVRRRFQRCDLATFGSTAQNLYLPDSDIDLTVTSPREMNREAKVKMLYALSGALKNSLITQNPFVVRKTRVPVIYFDTTPELGSYKCDTTVNSDGLKSVSVVAEYLGSMPALRYLVLVIKGYLSRIQLGSTGTAGLGSYGTILLVVSFLQRNPKSMPVEDITRPLECESLGRLLMGFLEHYGFHFDYANSVVSVMTGGIITKASKGWVVENRPGLLSIEDPTNTENDVGKSTKKIRQVQKAFRDAYGELQTYPLSMHHANALGTILGMSPEVVARREKLKEMVDSGSLDRWLQEIRIPPGAALKYDRYGSG